MPSDTTRCPSCGADASGRFCRACGASLGTAVCPSCGTSAPAGAVYCARCGSALGGGTATGARKPGLAAKAAFIAAGALAAAALGLFLLRGTSEAPAAPATSAAAPDISQLSPEERFDRLYRRVMQAARTGDTMATRLAPMALGAYEMLDSVDADKRYHAALIKLHLGDAAGARALGDSILAHDSTHLLGFVARGMAFRWERDTVQLRPVYAAFRQHAAAELARRRPEYAEHQLILREFQQAAEGRPTPPRTPG